MQSKMAKTKAGSEKKKKKKNDSINAKKIKITKTRLQWSVGCLAIINQT